MSTVARSLFLSDLHLGSPHCHAEELCEFLATVQVEQLYLVGDIVDLWWISGNRVRLQRSHVEVLGQLRRLARGGARVTYIPGNHDQPLRELCGMVIPGMVLRRDAIHRAADGRRYLVTHGDDFDAKVAHSDWREKLGDRIYDQLLAGNRLTNKLRRRLGLRYWSLADFIKRRSRLAECYIERYIEACVDAALARGVDGVVCGHIHRPGLFARRGVVYANDGDWVESLTALSENARGELTLLRWRGCAEIVQQLPRAQSSDLEGLPLAA